jgi:P27 family predicted phage terminase small subunit
MPKPKKPTSLRILDGDAPYRINGDEPKSPPGLGDPPDWLDALAREEWARVRVVVEGMGVATRADSAGAALYCHHFSVWRRAWQTIDREGMTIETDTTVKSHPAVGIANTAAREMAKLLGQFGMTPSARAGLHVRETPAEGSVADYFKPKGG